MATIGSPSSALFWCGWSGGGEGTRGDSESESSDATPPSELTATAAIFSELQDTGRDDTPLSSRAGSEQGCLRARDADTIKATQPYLNDIEPNFIHFLQETKDYATSLHNVVNWKATKTCHVFN